MLVKSPSILPRVRFFNSRTKAACRKRRFGEVIAEQILIADLPRPIGLQHRPDRSIGTDRSLARTLIACFRAIEDEGDELLDPKIQSILERRARNRVSEISATHGSPSLRVSRHSCQLPSDKEKHRNAYCNKKLHKLSSSANGWVVISEPIIDEVHVAIIREITAECLISLFESSGECGLKSLRDCTFLPNLTPHDVALRIARDEVCGIAAIMKGDAVPELDEFGDFLYTVDA